METRIKESVARIMDHLKGDERLSQYIDPSLPIPEAYRGTGEIKLVVLGQDPTVKNADSRKQIKTVLNLDKNFSVTAYLSGVCRNLGISLRENVYATNVYKNFFIQPPTTIKGIDVFSEYLDAWFPILQEELGEFGELPVMTLGEPILAPLLKPGMVVKVREYWGYDPEWREGKTHPFGNVQADDNKIGMNIFPFPHQPSIRKEFYKTNLERYCSYMKGLAFSA